MSVILNVAAAILSCSTVTLETIEGDKYTGALTQLDHQHAVIKNAQDSATVDVEQVLRVVNEDSLAPNAEPQLTVWLIDGSILAATRFELQDDLAKIGLQGATIEIDSRHLQRVRFRKPVDTHPFDKSWDEILTRQHEGDVVVIRKSDQVLDYLEGVIGNITADEVGFSFDGDNFDVKRGKLEGLAFLTSRTEARQPVRVAHSADGSMWHAEDIRWSAGSLEMKLMCGAKIGLPESAIRSIDYAATRIVYLSSLEPYKQTVTPRISATALDDLTRRLIYNPGIDENLSGGRLSLFDKDNRQQWRYFDRGLALHSRTELVYRLPDKFSQLQGIVGLDPELRQRGQVRLFIEGDERVLLDQQFGANDAPLPINLDLSGVERLRILVDYGDDSDAADHLNLCEMRLTP